LLVLASQRRLTKPRQHHKEHIIQLALLLAQGGLEIVSLEQFHDQKAGGVFSVAKLLALPVQGI